MFLYSNEESPNSSSQSTEVMNASSSPASIPVANAPPTSPPMLVPAATSIGMRCSSSHRITPTCAMPRALPPPNATPTLGGDEGGPRRRRRAQRAGGSTVVGAARAPRMRRTISRRGEPAVSPTRCTMLLVISDWLVEQIMCRGRQADYPEISERGDHDDSQAHATRPSFKSTRSVWLTDLAPAPRAAGDARRHSR